MTRFYITFERNGKIHQALTYNVYDALYGCYGLLVGETGHLNKILKISETR